MSRKSIISIVLVAVFLVGIAAAPAAAGRRQRGRLEGFVLGFGTAVLGHTLLHQQHHRVTGHYRQPVDRHPPRGYHHRRYGHRRPHADRHPHARRFHHRRGHWKFERVWVPPAFEMVWKPGHRGYRGRWIQGGWVKVAVSKGHWEKRKVWTAGRKRPGRGK